MALEKPKELERQKLEENISEIRNKPLGIVIAPSGYGKTMAVRCFLQKTENIIYTWLSLGVETVDEMWVWRKICSKLEEIAPSFYKQLSELGMPVSIQETEHFIKLVRNNLDKEFFFILDDYHECNSSNINRLLVRLAYEDLSMLHIILIGRTYPEIPYAELFLKGYCAVIDQQMLTLTKEETEQAFSINGIELSEQEKLSIEKYTDGWIAAVYLSLFEYKRTGGFGNFQGVVHMLKTAVFDKLSPVMQEVCMKMSIFGVFTYEQAVYVTECQISENTLLNIVNWFGFMQYEPLTKCFEIHSLLKSVASAELDKSPFDKKRLYNRCAEWCEKTKEYMKAVVHYRNAGNTDKIYQLLSGDMKSILFETAPTVIGDIIGAAPLDVNIQYPAAYLFYIYYVVVEEDVSKGRKMLEEVKEEYNCRYGGGEEYDRLWGELYILKSVMQFNDLKQITSSMREADRLRNGKRSDYFRQFLLTYGSPNMTILYYDSPGNLKNIIELEKEYTRYYMKLIAGVEGGWDELFEAEYELLTGNMEKAYELAEIVEKKAMFRQQLCIVISSYFIQLQCLIYFGKRKEFDDCMKEFQKKMSDIARPILIVDYELTYSVAYANIGRVDKMADWVRELELEKCSRMVRSIRSGCTAYGIMLCKKKEWVILDAIAEQILVPYETARHLYVMIFGYLFKAISAFYTEGMDKAKPYLDKAIELAEPDEVRIPFIETGAELSPMIESSEIKGRFFNSLKPHIKQWQHSLKIFDKERERILLTARENELMNLVRKGYRNSEISERMNIALVTVEKNLTSIYRKLDVSNRAAAIAKMDELI